MAADNSGSRLRCAARAVVVWSMGGEQPDEIIRCLEDMGWSKTPNERWILIWTYPGHPGEFRTDEALVEELRLGLDDFEEERRKG